MIAKHCEPNQLFQALQKVNKKYDNNIIFKREPERRGSHHIFTLRVKDSKGPGHRIGTSGIMGFGGIRRSISACWHVHGQFFDALFKICPWAVIVARGKTITADDGNWEDSNIGSIMHPVQHSEACDCED